MTSLYKAALNLTESIKQLQVNNLELRFLNLAEIERALEIHRPIPSLPEIKPITTILLPAPERIDG